MTADPSLFAPRKSVDVEQGTIFAPKFDDNGLITVVTVDHQSGEVLMVAYMNEQALAKTIELGEAVYWSRSRKELWHKGATSGLTQKVKEILTDCDQDALVLRVESVGGACCHVGYRSCFYRAVPGKGSPEGAKQRPLPLTYTQKEKAFDPEKVYGKKS